MAKPRVVNPGSVEIQRRDNNEIVQHTIPVISRDADVHEEDDCFRMVDTDGSKHWYPKDALLGVIIRGVKKPNEPEEAT